MALYIRAKRELVDALGSERYVSCHICFPSLFYPSFPDLYCVTSGMVFRLIRTDSLEVVIFTLLVTCGVVLQQWQYSHSFFLSFFFSFLWMNCPLRTPYIGSGFQSPHFGLKVVIHMQTILICRKYF